MDESNDIHEVRMKYEKPVYDILKEVMDICYEN